MPSFAHVTEEQVSQLGPVSLAMTIRALVNAELVRANIGLHAADIPLTITLSDGGEDGIVSWQGGPESAGRILGRRTMYQMKAGQCDPADCAREMRDKTTGGVPERIKANFEAGGRYVLVMSRSCSGQMRSARVKAMRTSLKQAGFDGFADALIDIYSGDVIASWVNEHYGVALDVHSLLGVPISDNFQPWRVWAETPRLTRPEFATDDATERRLSSIRSTLLSPRQCIRMIGLSGLGKTRLALEAFRPSKPSAAETLSRPSLASSIVYVDALDASDIPTQLMALRQRQRHAIVIVDNCDLDLHLRLLEIVEHSQSRLSMLSIDYDLAKDGGSGNLIELGRASPELIAAMLRRSFPEIRDSDLHRIVAFCDGYPRIAARLIESGVQDDMQLAPLTDDQLRKRLLWGRGLEDEAKLQSIRGCAVFHHHGFRRPLQSHRDYVARVLCDQTPETFRRNIMFFIHRGIVDQLGIYVRVSPLPLALRLADEWFEHASEELQESLFLTDAMPEDLADSLGKRFALLSQSSRAAELVRRLARPGGPFCQLRVLDSKRASRIFRSFVDVDPESCLQALHSAFSKVSDEELRDFRTGRRDIVWALERLVFDAERFHVAANLLLRLSVAENETWSNNATSTLLHLYSSLLSGTEASPLKRLAVIDDALGSESRKRREIAIRALGHAISTRLFSRLGVEEVQGRKTYADWSPNNLDDLIAYGNACLQRLSLIATEDSDLGSAARRAIVSGIRSQVDLGNIAGVDRSLRDVRKHHLTLWPEAIEAVDDALRYEGERLTPESRLTVASWKSLLAPTTLADRLHVLVREPAPGWVRFEQTASPDELLALASDMLQTAEWDHLLPMLLRPPMRRGIDFGERISRLAGDRNVIGPALQVAEAMPASEIDPAFIAGLLLWLREVDASAANIEMGRIAAIESLVPHYAWIAAIVGVTDETFHRAGYLVASRRVVPATLRVFSYGRVLRDVSSSVMRDSFESVAALNTEARWTTLSVLSPYALTNDDLWSSCDSLLREIISDYKVMCSTDIPTMDRYSYETTFDRVAKGRRLRDIEVERFARGIVEFCRIDQMDFSAYDMLRPVLFYLMKREKDRVWPLIRDEVDASDVLGHLRWNHLTLDKGPGKPSQSAFAFLDPRDVIEWGQRSKMTMLSVLPRELPLFREEGQKIVVEPLVRTLLDGFGDSDVLLHVLSANLLSFAHTGFADAHYAVRRSFVRSLRDHKRSTVVAWAASFEQQLAALESSEREREVEWNAGILTQPLLDRH